MKNSLENLTVQQVVDAFKRPDIRPGDFTNIGRVDVMRGDMVRVQLHSNQPSFSELSDSYDALARDVDRLRKQRDDLAAEEKKARTRLRKIRDRQRIRPLPLP